MSKKNGSIRLANAMHQQFRRFSIKYGVTLHDARIMLMNGVSL